MKYDKENRELISVIVPVYKVEKYIRRCLDSIITQSYKDIEIILVDDGSPDDCGRICDLYASADERIKVIHQQNGGLSHARNRGVEAASGKYITFIDSDDYIAPNYIEHLFSLLTENNADISCCCMVKTDLDSAEFYCDSTTIKVQVLSGKECCYALFGDLYLTLVTAWGKLYKSEIVKKHLFPLNRKHEDEATTCKYYYEAENVAISNARLYAYYQNMAGIMHTLRDGINHDAIWALAHRARFFEENGESSIAQLAWKQYFYYCVEDTINHNWRCDEYLIDFEHGKSLSKRVIFESRLFNTSRLAFKVYRGIINKLYRIRNHISHRNRRDSYE